MAKFKAVARVKTGTVVTGYDIENEKGQRLRIDRTYMCYLVGQGLMEDITGAIYKDTVVLKGNLNQLPVVSVKEKPEGQNTVRALVKDVRTVVGAYYEGNDILIPRDVLEQDALSGKLTNLDAQRYKGKVLFKGCRNLPVEQIKHEQEVTDTEEKEEETESIPTCVEPVELYTEYVEIADPYGTNSNINWEHSSISAEMKKYITDQTNYLQEQIGKAYVKKFDITSIDEYDETFENEPDSDKARVDIFLNGKYSDLVIYYNTCKNQPNTNFLVIHDGEDELFEDYVGSVEDLCKHINVDGLYWK